MRVTVVIPTYRRARALGRCLDSLACQTRPADEVVIVCRGSDRDTVRLVQSRDDLPMVLVEVGEVSTITVLENVGLDHASGDVMCFIDDDATAPPTWLATIEGHFDSDPSIGGVGGPVLPVMGGAVIRQPHAGPVHVVSWYGRVTDGSKYVTPAIREVDHLRGANMAFRRRLLGCFVEDLLGYCHRFEMERCLALRRAGWRILLDPRLAVEHYLEPRLYPVGFAEYFSIQSNNTRVLLAHLGPVAKMAFLPFTFLWGDGGSPGVVKILAHSAIHLCPIKGAIMLAAACTGKLHGLWKWMTGVLAPGPPGS